MATTYGYGGEFSSDEDIDKIEQRAEQLAQAKSGVFKPTRQQIEDFIRTMRKEPIDADDLDMPDDLLAGLLDYFKTQRGPIVDSTRGLYKKIVLKLIHGDTQQTNQANNGDNFNNNNNNNNNNVLIGKVAPRQVADKFSSDEDDDPVVPKDASKKRFDPRVVDDKATRDSQEVVDDNEDSMEIDSETPNGPPRNTKQVEISTTDEDETDESSTEESSSEDEDQESDNDVLEVTPIKPSNNQTSDMMQDGTAATPVSKQLMQSSVKRQQPLAHSTPKETIESCKKPYTRSQRMAASRVTSLVKDKKDPTDVKLGSSSASVSSSSNRISRRKYILLTVTILMVLVAVGIYFIKPDLMMKPKNALKF